MFVSIKLVRVQLLCVRVIVNYKKKAKQQPWKVFRDTSRAVFVILKPLSTVGGPVSGHKRRKHVFRTSEGLQSAEINPEISFSIQETGV